MERFFHQVPKDEGLAKIGKGANLYGAPLAVIVCADHGKAWVRPFDKKQTTDIDASRWKNWFPTKRYRQAYAVTN